jgi:RNA-directed DNA polymerase
MDLPRIIRKCFEKIDHDKLLTKLNTFPQMEKQIKAWLKASLMEGYAFEGAPH